VVSKVRYSLVKSLVCSIGFSLLLSFFIFKNKMNEDYEHSAFENEDDETMVPVDNDLPK